MMNEDAPLPHDVYAALPGVDAVMQQKIVVDGSRWQKALSERGLPLLQGKLADPGRAQVSRSEVFEMGSREVTSENAFQLLYYSLAWGLGLKGSHLHQRLDGLAKNQDRAGELLASAWAAVRNEAPAQEAYSILTSNRGGGRISWLGPAFSTKFLYFAQSSNVEPRYLILDNVVSGNLPDAWPGAARSAWFPETYGRYCNLLCRWAEQATARLDGSRKVRADEIELVLFQRHLPPLT